MIVVSSVFTCFILVVLHFSALKQVWQAWNSRLLPIKCRRLSLLAMGCAASVPTLALATATIQYGFFRLELTEEGYGYVIIGLLPVCLCSLWANEMSRFLQSFSEVPRYGSVPTAGGILVLQPIVLVGSLGGLLLTLATDEFVNRAEIIPAVTFAALGFGSCLVLSTVTAINGGKLTEPFGEEAAASGLLRSANPIYPNSSIEMRSGDVHSPCPEAAGDSVETG
eukprot:CAMPEP_0204351248 /NCGR_PEP_ID=MMETSP0469-20131031/30968_1 /ASSEMBLY_ACC=CAM_ASM_000384 /TAXON_ID=2969 /ORGANISM="Oxyrrhis marina" /LENGTH=223 /DNA_ID=CAMNT_0051337749 /DNA_START=262 /DNA_END=933 /DNA_ORIENTATION=+